MYGNFWHIIAQIPTTSPHVLTTNMNLTKIIVVLIANVLLFAVSADAQRRKTHVVVKPVKTAPAKQVEPRPGYEFEIKVFADGSLQLKVMSGYETRGLSN